MVIVEVLVEVAFVVEVVDTVVVFFVEVVVVSIGED